MTMSWGRIACLVVVSLAVSFVVVFALAGALASAWAATTIGQMVLSAIAAVDRPPGRPIRPAALFPAT
jgi:hypothetical protein